MNKCLTCETTTKYDQCPSCNPDAFTDESHETVANNLYKGLAFLTQDDFDTKITMLKAMIKSVDEDSKVIPNLCKALDRAKWNRHLKIVNDCKITKRNNN